MFFWNSLAFSMIQRMLAIWSLVPLPFLNPAWTSGTRTSGSNRLAINQRFPQPPFLGFNSSSRLAQRIQETHTLTISAIYHKGHVRVRIDSQMKRYVQRGSEGASVLWKLGDGQSSMQKLSGSPTWMFSEVPPFGFLWRLQYTGTID